MTRAAAAWLLLQGLVACGGGNAPEESSPAYLFLSPSSMFVAPGQPIEVQFDIANLPAGDAASGYAISLSEATTRIRIDPSAVPCDSGTVSCKRYTVRPDADAPAGDFAFVVRASGTRTPVEDAHARISVVPIAQGRRALRFASANHLISADGRLWARGSNEWGQTGVGFESVGFDPNEPFVLPDFIDPFVQVGTDTDWVAVVSAGETTIALKDDGTVWGWGANPKFEVRGHSFEPTAAYFQLGVPSPRDIQLRPRQIPGLADIAAISAVDVVPLLQGSGYFGPARFLALARAGTVYGFGGGVGPRYNRQVDGTNLYEATGAPLQVPRAVSHNGIETVLDGVTAIVGGVENTGEGWALALRNDGSVWQMGHRGGSFINNGGARGILAGPAMPFAVAGLPPNAIAVAVGELDAGRDARMMYSLAATQDGSVWSWTEQDPVPQRVAGFTHPVVALDSTFGIVNALDNQGGLWRWTFGRDAPQRVEGVPVMGRLAHRGTQWAISGDCAAGGELWDVRRAQRSAEFGGSVIDGCPARGQVRLTLAKVGNGTISLDPLDAGLVYACGADCPGPVSLSIDRRQDWRVRATPAPGWGGPFFNRECSDGRPLLDADTTCTATFTPEKREGALTVEVSGAGHVTSTPAGIDCGADCREVYALGTRITLTPMADSGSAFLGWSGPSHTNESDCRGGTVTMNVVYDTNDSAYPLKTCIAIFGPLPRLTVAPAAGGTVTSTPAGIDCGAACALAFAAGTEITLGAAAAAGYRFDGFIEAECRAPVTLTRDLRCTPQFTAVGAGQLTVSVSGNGRVTSAPAGIDCGSDCAEAFAPGSIVTLTAVPASGASFAGWSGDADCSDGVVSLDSARSCLASFVASGWQAVGGAVAEGSTPNVAIAIDNSVATRPIIYAATAMLAAGRYDVLVRRFDGSNWELVGNGPINADAAVSSDTITPAIAIGPGGMPSVAWAENRRQLRVKQWNGNAWTALAEDLRVDTNEQVFGIQIVPANGRLLVAWLETVNNVQGQGRMAMKRFGPGALTWPGGTVLPAQTNVLALRLSSEAAGNALLLFVTFDASAAQLEGPLRLLREGIAGDWTDVCGPLARPAAISASFYPQTRNGFGVAKLAFPASDPVAVFNNGDAVFARKCRGGNWSGLDGGALGLVAAPPPGESFWGLAVAQGEGYGVGLAWTKLARTNGNVVFVYDTQVLVENGSSTGFEPRAPALHQDNVGFQSGTLSLGFPRADSPLLAGTVSDGRPQAARVFRYLP